MSRMSNRMFKSVPVGGFKWPLDAGSFSPGVVYLVTDRDFLKACRKELWSMIQSSYASSGGYKGHDNVRTLIKDTAKAKMVFASDERISAVAFYSAAFGGNKRFCSAKNYGVPDSTAAVRLIVRDDIEDLDGYWWVETSGGIEHIFAEMRGNPIPNEFAREILNVKMPVRLDPDGVHYTRSVGKHHDMLRKVIFGFKDAETAKRVCTSVANYEEFRLKTCADIVVGQLHESAKGPARTVEWAYAVVAHMNVLRSEWECREMLPEWEETLRKARSILKAAEVVDVSRRDGCLEYIESCFSEMPPIRVRRFSA